MVIRIMTIDDYEAVFKLWLSCKGMALNNVGDSKDGIEKFLKRNPTTCFVAEDEGEIVGVILGGHDGRCGNVHHAAVAPSHRNRGIGGMLGDKVEQALREEGITKIFLLAFSKNEEGNGFWNSRGYILRKDLNVWDKQLIKVERLNVQK